MYRLGIIEESVDEWYCHAFNDEKMYVVLTERWLQIFSFSLSEKVISPNYSNILIATVIAPLLHLIFNKNGL